jgi:LysM repeat protein
MARRRNKRGRNKGAQGPGRWVALGVAGVLGLGIAIKARGGDEAPPSLVAPPIAVGDQRDGAGTGGAPAPRAAVPANLCASFTKLGQASLHPILDLRRIAVEYPGTAEAGRASQALSDLSQRSLAAARQPQAKPEQALRAMTRAYVATVDARSRRDLRQEALQLSERAIGAKDSSLFREYRVKRGDALSRIARRHKTDYRTIKRYSGMKRDSLQIGQRLRIPKTPPEIVIFKGDFELLIVLEGCLVRAFDVATGKDGKTPEGRFTIGTKTVNPTWYSPGGKVYKFGSPENILGTRWMAFKNTDEHKGFGIHGTKFPESIGTEASMGCIRMRNAEVEVVYDYIPSRTQVRIVK